MRVVFLLLLLLLPLQFSAHAEELDSHKTPEAAARAFFEFGGARH